MLLTLLLPEIVLRNLRRVFLLVDARWGLKSSDLCLLSFFERHHVPYQIVLTKADLPEQKSLIKVLQLVGLRFPLKLTLGFYCLISQPWARACCARGSFLRGQGLLSFLGPTIPGGKLAMGNMRVAFGGGSCLR